MTARAMWKAEVDIDDVRIPVKLYAAVTDALLALAEQKRAENRDVVEVEERVAEDEAESGDVIDIMSVLKERMGAARAPSRRESAKRTDHPTSERRASSKPAHGSRSRRRTSSGTSSRP